MKNLSSLNSYFWKYKRLFLSGVLFIILTNVFGVYSPKIVKMAMDLIGSVVGAQGDQSSLARLFAELQTLVHSLEALTVWNGNQIAGVLALHDHWLMYSTLEKTDTLALYQLASLGIIPAVKSGRQLSLARRWSSG